MLLAGRLITLNNVYIYKLHFMFYLLIFIHLLIFYKIIKSLEKF